MKTVIYLAFCLVVSLICLIVILRAIHASAKKIAFLTLLIMVILDLAPIWMSTLVSIDEEQENMNSSESNNDAESQNKSVDELYETESERTHIYEITSTEKQKKVYIYDIEPFLWEEGGFRRIDRGKDNLGTEYLHVLTEYNSGHMFQDSGSSETYRLDRNYDILHGIFFIPYEYRNTSNSCYLRVTGDGNELYYKELSRGDEPDEFVIDISKIDELKIDLVGHTIDTGMNMALPYLADCYFEFQTK